MKALIFDTETSGLRPGWNVILQLSYQIVDTDTWEVVKEVNHFFDYPEDLSRVEEGAIAVNGLTPERLAQEVLSNRHDALLEFDEDKDFVDLLVAHNLEFDKKFIIASGDEEGVKYIEKGWKNTYDSMLRNVEFCKLPKRSGSGYKWPRLYELADCLYVDYSDLNLHDSSADVELTKRCFRALFEQGMINQ